MTDVVLAYERPSRLAEGPAGRILDLGVAAVPVGGAAPFFDGWAARPGLVARLLLTVAAVAQARYFEHAASRLLDPILTSGDGRLRLESFSSCCGVYARADLLPEALRDVSVGFGTTNVDLNRDVRDALGRVGDREEMRLSVGAAGLRVTTRDSSAFERKVALPKRWVRGLGEAALAQLGMRPQLRIDAGATRRLLAGLPPAGDAWAPPYAVVSRGRDLRFTQPVRDGTPVVAGPFRLRELRPLAAYALGLTVWARPGTNSSGWQLDLPGARMWLILSPDIARGFSGEGQALEALADPAAVEAATALRDRLSWSARLEEARIAADTAVPVDRVGDLLAVLGSQGLVGRDAAEDAWFRRDLPFVADRIATLQPRVRRAAEIDQAGLSAAPIAGGHEVFVPSGQIEHRVVLIGDGARCTCKWYGRHQGSRGPCRHVLAARRFVAGMGA